MKFYESVTENAGREGRCSPQMGHSYNSSLGISEKPKKNPNNNKRYLGHERDLFNQIFTIAYKLRVYHLNFVKIPNLTLGVGRFRFLPTFFYRSTILDGFLNHFFQKTILNLIAIAT